MPVNMAIATQILAESIRSLVAVRVLSPRQLLTLPLPRAQLEL
jgi:hypothetical protein